MKALSLGLSLISLFFTSGASWASPLSSLQDAWVSELQTLGSIYADFYAPRELKEKVWGWNYDAQIAQAELRLRESRDVHGARQAIVGFLNSLHDYHVFYAFSSTEKASLPIELRTIGGRVFVIWLDPKAPEIAGAPLAVGDEILEIDGTPVADVQRRLSKTVGKNWPATDQSLVDLCLTLRQGSANFEVPQGRVVFRTRNEQGEHQVSLVWNYVPEKIQAPRPSGVSPAAWRRLSPILSPRWRELVHPGSPFSIGGKHSFVPALGRVLWQSPEDDRFQAYLFESPTQRRIGFVRIGTYNPSSDDPNDLALAVQDFSKIIAKFQSDADALVIDQTNNPGGATSYVFGLLGMLTDRPLAVPTHVMALNPMEADDYRAFLDQTEGVASDEAARRVLGESYEGFPVDLKFVRGMRDLATSFLRQWSEGKKLSSPLHLLGVNRIDPNPETRFTKPLFVLTNELDFSGADFFPAILQDNARAKIIGTRTAGAGGYVLSTQFMNHFGLETVWFTASVATRSNGQLLENQGVTPDFPLAWSSEDPVTRFSSFAGRLVQIVEDQLRAIR